MELKAAFALLVTGAAAAAPYCLPGQPCFPSAAELQAFNASVSGRLLAPAPYGSVCYAGAAYDAGACRTLVENKRLAAFRETIPAAMMVVGTEFDPLGRGCPVPDAVPAAPLTSPCVLGGLGTYFVNATTPAHVSAAVAFAAKRNLRLRIKNTGHDYTGRSTDPGAFVVLTHNFKDVALDKTFAACGKPSSAVVTVDAGVVTSELYAATEKFGVMTTGSFANSIGAGGGWVLGGGMAGPFQPLFGLGVDNVIQYDVVLANGTLAVANACTNPDLFWAMRGGGGVFAVATRTYFKAQPAFEAVNAVVGVATASSRAAYDDLVSRFVQQDPSYGPAFDAGSWNALFPNISLLFVKGFAPGDAVVPANASRSAFDFLGSIAGVTTQLVAEQFPTWNAAYTSLLAPSIVAGAVVGADLLVTSRIVSKALLGSSAGRTSIANYISSLPQGQGLLFQRVAGGAVSNVPIGDTPVNPAWRSAQAYVDIPVISASNGPFPAAQNATTDGINASADKVFGTNAYYNEDNTRDAGFQARFWGANYPRLLAIKERYDPGCVFTGAATVGQLERCGT